MPEGLDLEKLSPELKVQWIVLKKKGERTKEENMLLLATRVSDALKTSSLRILLGYIQHQLKFRKESREDKGSPYA